MENLKYEHIFVMGLMLLPLASCFSLDELTGMVKAIGNAYSGKNDPVYMKDTIPLDQTNDTNNTKIEQQWTGINQNQAEKGCLKQAKKVAVDGGYSESFVFNCKCAAEESADVKSYDCNVNALDGSHSVTILCIKTQNQCAVTSEQGTQSYNFDQLEQFANS